MSKKFKKIVFRATALAASILCLGVMGSSVSAFQRKSISNYQEDIANTVSSAPATVDEQIERASFVLDIARKDFVLIPNSVTVNRDEATTVYKAIAVRSPEVLVENYQKGLPFTRNTLSNYLNEVWNKIKDSKNLYTSEEKNLEKKDTTNPDDYERNACIVLKGEVDGTSIAKSGENWAVNLKKEQKNINGVDLYEFTLELPKELDDKLNSNEKIGFDVYKFTDDVAGPFKIGGSCIMNTHPELVKNKTPIGPFLMNVAIHSFERGQQFFADAGEKQAAACNKLEKNLKQSNKTVLTKEEVDNALAEVESTIANDVPQGDLVAIFGE